MSDAPETATKDQDEGLFPVPSTWFEVGFYVLLLGWLVYLLVETTGYDDFEDYLFPYLLGVPLIMIIVVHLVTIRYPWIVDRLLPDEETSAARTDVEERVDELDLEEEEARPTAERERWEIYMLVWVVLLPLMMYYAGMGWTIVVYTFAFTVFLTKDLRKAFLVTVVVIAFIYVLFLRLLEMIIWRGVWGLPDPLSYLELLL